MIHTRSGRLTGQQFETLATLLHSRGVSREACRLVLVDGLRQCEAARRLSVSPVLINMSLARYRRARAAIDRAFGPPQ